MSFLLTDIQTVNSIGSDPFDTFITQDNMSTIFIALAVVVVVAFIIGKIRTRTEDSKVFNAVIPIVIFIAAVVLIYYASQTNIVIKGDSSSGEVVEEIQEQHD
jgi:hypothetical protein